MGASAVTLLCLAIILSCAPPSIDAQTCEAFAGTPSYCCGYVNYDVLIPPGQNQSLIAATLLQELPETILPFITGDCKTYTLLMSCGLAFRKCNSTDPLAAPPLPMCTDTCNTFNSVCAEQLKLGGKPPRNCSTEIDPFSGALLYQTGASCANPNPPPACPDGPTKVTSCATYFVPNLEGTDCVPGCRFPPFHDKKRNAITQNIFRYITPFSILLELVLVATWLVIWDPKRPLYVAFFMAGLFAQHCAFFIGKWYSFEDWQCINEREYRTQANTGCAIQGFFALIGTYTPIAWIGVILYHLFNSVTQQRYQIFGDGKLIPIDPKYVYHILVWVLIGLLLTVIPFFQNRINARAGYVCYPDIAVDDSKYLYGLLFSPLTVMVVVEIILTIVLFVFIIRLAGVSGLKTQGRLTALCIYYLWCTSYLIFNAWNVFRNRHDTADKIRDHVTCVVANFQRGWTTNDTVGCPPAPVWNDNKELFGDVLVSSTGLVIGLILLDPRFLRIWKKWICCEFQLPAELSGGSSTNEPSRENNSGTSRL